MLSIQKSPGKESGSQHYQYTEQTDDNPCNLCKPVIGQDPCPDRIRDFLEWSGLHRIGQETIDEFLKRSEKEYQSGDHKSRREEIGGTHANDVLPGLSFLRWFCNEPP